MLGNSYGDETLEELTAAVIMMARIQPSDNNDVIEPNYDEKVVSEVNASHKMIPKGVHEHKYHGKRKTVVNTSDDDQIDSNIIFDDPYVENNGGSAEHDSNAHDQYHDVKIIAYNVQREAKNKKRLNNELKKQKELLQKKLEISGLGYQNPERLKKAFAAQPKMYHGEMLQSTNVKTHSPDSEETLEDAEEKPSAEQTYFSIPSTFNVCSESNEAMSDLQIPKMPKESNMLKMFDKMDLAIMELRDRIDDTLLEDRYQNL
ncbi:hypothetical protein Tco_0880530 [Tanacetum coccineum]